MKMASMFLMAGLCLRLWDHCTPAVYGPAAGALLEACRAVGSRLALTNVPELKIMKMASLFPMAGLRLRLWDRCTPAVHGPAVGALLEAYRAVGLRPALTNVPELKS